MICRYVIFTYIYILHVYYYNYMYYVYYIIYFIYVYLQKRVRFNG